MAEYPSAIIVAAIFLSAGHTLFTKPYSSHDGCQCTTISSFIFLTAVFSWLSGKKFKLFKCPLPQKAAFFYELFVSLFVLEMALKMFWDPIECFFSASLPALIDDYVLDGECILGGLYCPGDNAIFILFIYILAVTSLWAVLYGYGVISFSL